MLNNQILSTIKNFAFIFIISNIFVSLSVLAEQSEAEFTVATRYNLIGQVTGVISPRPAANKSFPAVRNTYNQQGLLVTVEKGVLVSFQNETVNPVDWTGFSVYKQQSFGYDDLGRKTSETSELVTAAQNNSQPSSVAAIASVIEYSYDEYNRVVCIAKRLNGTILGDACELGVNTGFGDDRITTYEYTTNGFGLVAKERRAVGTTDEQVYITNDYDFYGKLTDQTDANNNLTHLEYNDRNELETMYFPDKVIKNQYSTTDKESYTYDDNGNRKTLTKRDGNTITYDYDNLNREIKKTIPTPANGSQNVYTSYDLLNLKTSARFGSATGVGITYTYSGFGEMISESSNVSGNTYNVQNDYDKHSNRTAVTYNDDAIFSYVYDGLDRNTSIHEGDVTAAVLIQNQYDNFARQETQTTAGNATTSITYDKLSRPSSIGWTLTTTAYNSKNTFGYNPAGQIVQHDLTNDFYQYKEAGSKVGSYTVNNLNQYTNVGQQVYGYDKNGNLLCDGIYDSASAICTLGTRYTYDIENRLVSLSGDKNATLKYDPAGRLYQITANGNTTNFHYNGDQMIGEFSGPTLLKRYVFGAGVDKPVVAYKDNTITPGSRLFLHSNHQGSVVLASNNSGNMLYVNTYDAYGVPGKVNQGRFGYTGQINLPEIGLYYYKARIYYPQIGRFLQTDPVGYEDDYNLYAYVGNDPVNTIDPTGKFAFLLLFAPELILAAEATLFVGSAVTVAAVASDAIDTSGESNAPSESQSGSTSPTGKPAPIEGATWVNTTGRKGTDIWDKPGSLEDAVGDAEGKSESGLTDRGNGVSTGTDADGNEIVVRPGGGEYTGGKEKGERANATIEIKPPRVEGEKPPPPTDKIRYR